MVFMLMFYVSNRAPNSTWFASSNLHCHKLTLLSMIRGYTNHLISFILKQNIYIYIFKFFSYQNFNNKIKFTTQRTQIRVLATKPKDVEHEHVEDQNYVCLLHSYGNLCFSCRNIFLPFYCLCITSMPHHFPTMN